MEPRFENFLFEHGQPLLPIEGYQNEPLVPLQEAVESLFDTLDRKILEKQIWIVKERCKYPADGLSQDESASIMLYTLEWNPSEQSVYFILNQTLRLEDRQKLKIWFPYLKLFLTALSRLPSITTTVFRGIKADLTSQYKKNNSSIWWGVSSCTDNIDVLQSEQFCGKIGVRTMFIIKCLSGRSIKNHSYFRQESEIILMPGRYLQVSGQYDLSNEIHMIQLEEITPPHEIFTLSAPDPWRQIERGICLEGICVKSSLCIAHKKQVIIPIGFRKFDVLRNANAKIVKCPMCLNYIEIIKIGFSHCQWRWYGIRQTSPNEQPIEYNGDWSCVYNYFTFQHNIQGTDIWLQLVVEAKPK